jgi:hypothetical protein
MPVSILSATREANTTNILDQCEETGRDIFLVIDAYVLKDVHKLFYHSDGGIGCDEANSGIIHVPNEHHGFEANADPKVRCKLDHRGNVTHSQSVAHQMDLLEGRGQVLVQ